MRLAVVVLLSITALQAADKKATFSPRPADSYPGHVTADKLTIAAVPYNTAELAATAFGKVKPHERGITPVLVVIKNDTGKALRLDLRTEFVTADREHLEAMPPFDVTRYQGVQRRPDSRSPIPKIPGINNGAKKGPLNTPEIEGRAFSVKLLPPGESAHGFVYFEVGDVKGAQLYVTGIKDAATGQAYFYYEVPLDAR
jgi:hypothetical protein